jgi:AraC family transcriptional regulator
LAKTIKRDSGASAHDVGMQRTGTHADTFVHFVDDLAQVLGDETLTADEHAARGLLSRSHFDRVIRATAGEPPGAFRRRLRLERAAYQLMTGDSGILDIALDAGYASHEAFDRAFRRAYGVTPSRWRNAPRQFRLPTPNDVHFHPPGGLRLPTRTEVTSVDLIIRMVEHHVWLLGEMLDRAAQLDDAALDRRIELNVEDIDENQTIRSLMSRLIGQMDMWNSVIHDRPYDWKLEEHESTGAMRPRLAEAGREFEAEVRRVVNEGRLDETFVDAECSPPEVFTYGGMIAHVLTFAAHRRVLVLGALESAGFSDLGAGDPRSWVAEPA